jgi:sec-independent protein translocase protein TatA
MGIGWSEIIPILIVVVILFGGKKIPELAKGIGQGIREFKKAMRDGDDEPTPASKEIEQGKK